MKYLGIKISKKPSALFKLNFMEKFNKLKENIEKWRTPPLSLIRHVNAVRMVSLLKFLHLFQNVPVFIPKSFFKAFQLHYHAVCSGVQNT